MDQYWLAQRAWERSLEPPMESTLVELVDTMMGSLVQPLVVVQQLLEHGELTACMRKAWAQRTMVPVKVFESK